MAVTGHERGELAAAGYIVAIDGVPQDRIIDAKVTETADVVETTLGELGFDSFKRFIPGTKRVDVRVWGVGLPRRNKTGSVGDTQGTFYFQGVVHVGFDSASEYSYEFVPESVE